MSESESTPISRETVEKVLSDKSQFGEPDVTVDEIMDELRIVQRVQGERADVWIERALNPDDTVSLAGVEDEVFYFLVESYTPDAPTEYYPDEIVGHLDVGQENYGEFMYSRVNDVMRERFSDVCSFPWNRTVLVLDLSDIEYGIDEKIIQSLQE